MYRDFVGADPRAARAGDEPRARACDDQRLMDQIYASRAARRSDRRTSTSSSSAAARAAARWRTRSRTPARASCVLERGGFVPQEAENWNPEAVWKHLRYRRDRALARRARARRSGPYTHYNVGGNTKFWGSVLYRLRREDFDGDRARRRRLAGVADRLRHARAVLRPRRARSTTCTATSATIRPSRRAAPYPYPPVPHARGMARASSSALRAHGAASVAAAARPAATRASRAAASSATPATRSRAGCTRRATRRSAASRRRSATPNVDALDRTRCATRLLTDPSGTPRRRRRGRARRRDVRVVSRAGRRRRRAARSTRPRCCCGRRPTRIRTAWRIRRVSSAAATWRTWRR